MSTDPSLSRRWSGKKWCLIKERWSPLDGQAMMSWNRFCLWDNFLIQLLKEIFVCGKIILCNKAYLVFYWWNMYHSIKTSFYQNGKKHLSKAAFCNYNTLVNWVISDLKHTGISCATWECEAEDRDNWKSLVKDGVMEGEEDRRNTMWFKLTINLLSLLLQCKYTNIELTVP